MLEEFAWMPGTTVAIKVSGSRSSREALGTRTDWYRDHVLLQSLVITDPGIPVYSVRRGIPTRHL